MARRAEAHIAPHESYKIARAFFVSRSPADFIIGPLGSGKTFVCLQKLLAIASEQKPNSKGVRLTRFGVLRNSWPELETALLPDVERFFLPLGARITRGIPPSMRFEAVLPDRTTLSTEFVFVAGLDQPDSEEKLRGHQWTGVWMNEMRQIPLAVMGMANGRTGRFPSHGIDGADPTWRGMIGDTNAFDVDHGLYSLMTDKKPKGWNFYIQPPGVLKNGSEWVTNPEAENLGHLETGYYERIAKGRPDDWVRVNLGNEFIFHTEGRPVYPQYQDSVHCVSGLLAHDGIPLRVGVDFGRTPAATVWQHFPQWGRWHGIAELVTVDEPAAEFAPRLKAFLDQNFPGRPIAAFGDPAGDREGQSVNITPIQFLNAAGIPTRPAYTNDPLLRRASLSKPMGRLAMDGKPAFQISDRMKVTRKGLQGAYVYARVGVRGKEQYRDVPEKSEWSHPIDSAEYAAVDVEGRGATTAYYPGADRERADWPEYAESEW